MLSNIYIPSSIYNANKFNQEEDNVMRNDSDKRRTEAIRGCKH
jgi:hypothetical protein